MKEYNSISLQDVQCQALRIWGDKTATFLDDIPEVKEVEVIHPETDLDDRVFFFVSLLQNDS